MFRDGSVEWKAPLARALAADWSLDFEKSMETSMSWPLRRGTATEESEPIRSMTDARTSTCREGGGWRRTHGAMGVWSTHASEGYT